MTDCQNASLSLQHQFGTSERHRECEEDLDPIVVFQDRIEQLQSMLRKAISLTLSSKLANAKPETYKAKYLKGVPVKEIPTLMPFRARLRSIVLNAAHKNNHDFTRIQPAALELLQDHMDQQKQSSACT